MYFFTADEHYGHRNIIQYCNRPFRGLFEMDNELIKRHNEVVSKNDVVVHVGDFTLSKEEIAKRYILELNGNHIFLKGSHDRWLSNGRYVWTKKIGGEYVVACHYAMRVWPKSHYGSIQLHGHSHGKLSFQKNQWDVGVDNNQFYPVSFDQIKETLDI